MDQREAGHPGLAPSLSVVVPTRNRPASLQQTVAGLLHQELPQTLYEIVVVDDGSEPPVRAEELGAPERVRVLRLAHGERSAARNFGAEQARGGFVVFMDDDMRPDPGLLQAHLVGQAEWAGALTVGSVRLPATMVAGPYGAFRQGLELRGLPTARGPVANPNFCTAQNMAVSRDRFRQLGGFDPQMASAEDQDLALRHTAMGGVIVFLPEAIATHDDVHRSLTSYCARSEWGAEQMAPFCRRYPDWPENRQRFAANGPVRWGSDTPGRILRKTLMRLLGAPPALSSLLATTLAIEAYWPSSPLLSPLYRLALGVHLQRGFRRGWADGLPNQTRGGPAR